MPTLSPSRVAGLVLALLAPLVACAHRPRYVPDEARPAEPAAAGASSPPPSSAPPPPSLVTFASGRLRGYLYRPPGAGPFPAVVFLHGSEREPGTKSGQAQFYVPRGYVVFVPHRRGHGESRDAGPYIGQFANDGPKLVAALDAHAEDVAAAVAYIGEQPFVDPRRIAVSGCSFGGIEALLAAERGTGLRAAVDFAGGAAMWARTPALQERLRTAARSARVPVFFVQAENDFDTTPSRVLHDEMRAAGKASRIHVFPPNGTRPEDGHAFCAGGPAPAWGPEVLAFLDEHLRP